MVLAAREFAVEDIFVLLMKPNDRPIVEMLAVIDRVVFLRDVLVLRLNTIVALTMDRIERFEFCSLAIVELSTTNRWLMLPCPYVQVNV